MEISKGASLEWKDRVWRKKGGFLRSVQISKELGLYRQSYCGCVYSKIGQGLL
jgi:predicted adenine nucleotide alpha hydrolase (AANH) superfamily ATPase